MYKKIVFGLSGLGLVGLVAVSAPSITLAETQTSTTTPAAAAPSIKDVLDIKYVNRLDGAAVTNPLSSRVPDLNVGRGSETDLVNLENYLGVAYKAAPDVLLGAVMNFALSPVQNHEFTMKDPYLKASHGKLINSGAFNVYADLRLGPGVSTKSRANNQMAFVMSKQNTTYDIPDTRLTVGAITLAKVNLFKGSLLDGQKDLNLEAFPNVGYKILPNLSAVMGYDMNASHVRSSGGLVSDGTSLQPGIDWDITPAINFNPYLDIKTGNRIAADTTTMGFWFTARLL